MIFPAEAMRLVVGAQPGQIGADLRPGDLGDVPVASVLDPLGQAVKIGVDGAGAQHLGLLGDGETVQGFAQGKGK